MRLLLLIGTLFATATAHACSCTNEHIPLEEAFCYADTTGGAVLDVQLIERGDGNRARMRILRVLLGETDLREIVVESRHSCSYFLPDGGVGQRYLYFAREWDLTHPEGDLFQCGHNANIYRMNRAGTQVEYAYPDNTGKVNEGLRYREFASALNERPCANDDGGGELPSLVSPLRHLMLSNNPGNGSTSLTATEGDFPPLEGITVYRTDGRTVAELAASAYTPGSPLDLTDLPDGYFIVLVYDGRFRRAFPYVKGE